MMLKKFNASMQAGIMGLGDYANWIQNVESNFNNTGNFNCLQ